MRQQSRKPETHVDVTTRSDIKFHSFLDPQEQVERSEDRGARLKRVGASMLAVVLHSALPNLSQITLYFFNVYSSLI